MTRYFLRVVVETLQAGEAAQRKETTRAVLGEQRVNKNGHDEGIDLVYNGCFKNLTDGSDRGSNLG